MPGARPCAGHCSRKSASSSVAGEFVWLRTMSAEHGGEPLARALAHLSMAFVNGPPRAAAHAGEELSMHLHEVVERGLLCLGEEARDQGIPLGGSEALEVIDVVAPPQPC